MLGTAGLNYYGQQKANKANVSSAREQMRWQEYMSNTQYQRTMKDMEDAGLNPILAAKLGGAGTPSGASAQSQNELSGATASAMEAKRMLADIAKVKADTALTGVMERKTAADIVNNGLTTQSQIRLQNAQGDLADSQIAMNAATVRNILQNMTLKSPMAPLADVAHDITSGAANLVKNFPSSVSSLTDRARREYKRYHK